MNRTQYNEWCTGHANRLQKLQALAVRASEAGATDMVAQLENMERALLEGHEDVTAQLLRDEAQARVQAKRHDRIFGAPVQAFEDVLRPPDPVEAFAAIGASLPAPPAPDTTDEAPDTTDPAAVEALASIGATGRTGVDWHENDEAVRQRYAELYEREAMVEDATGDRIPLRNYEHDIIADTGERVPLDSLEHLDGTVPDLDALEEGQVLQTRVTEPEATE